MGIEKQKQKTLIKKTHLQCTLEGQVWSITHCYNRNSENVKVGCFQRELNQLFAINQSFNGVLLKPCDESRKIKIHMGRNYCSHYSPAPPAAPAPSPSPCLLWLDGIKPQPILCQTIHHVKILTFSLISIFIILTKKI